MKPTPKIKPGAIPTTPSNTRAASNGISKPPRRRKCVTPTAGPSLTLHVSFSKVNGSEWDSSHWRTFPLRVASTKALSDVPALLKPLLLERVARDAYLRQHVVQFSMVLARQDGEGGRMSLGHERPRVELLRDLFLHPRAAEMSLDVEVRVKNSRVRHVAACREEAQVLLPECSDARARYRVVRVGYVPVVDAYRSEVQERRHGGYPDGVAYVQPLLAWVDRRTEAVHFSRVHAYDFDEFCIGDPDEWTPWNRVSFSNRHYFLGSLEQVQKKGESRAQFLQRLRHLMADDEDDDHDDQQQMGSGVPFLPTYCYNEYRPGDLGMGVAAFPRQGIDVAVRVINEYNASGEMRHVTFPRDIRIVVDGHDELKDILQLVREQINRRGKLDGANFDSDKLFGPEHEGRWEMHLWAMPQTGPRKLYRYTEGKLNQFLSPALTVRTRDKRLYVEAHVVTVNER